MWISTWIICSWQILIHICILLIINLIMPLTIHSDSLIVSFVYSPCDPSRIIRISHSKEYSREAQTSTTCSNEMSSDLALWFVLIYDGSEGSEVLAWYPNKRGVIARKFLHESSEGSCSDGKWWRPYDSTKFLREFLHELFHENKVLARVLAWVIAWKQSSCMSSCTSYCVKVIAAVIGYLSGRKVTKF